MITLLTCTGDRQRLFRRLEDWMARQTVRWSNWIVADDGIRPTPCTLGQRYLRLAPNLPPSVSFATNLSAILQEHASIRDSQYCFFVEDDDWYGPDYLASLIVNLLDHELVGESHFRYYNVAGRSYFHCNNRHHAPLCATAFRATLIPRILPLIDADDIYLDQQIWARVSCKKRLQRTRHCVGLKAQIGRPGLTSNNLPSFQPDPDSRVLQDWVGEDADEVLRYANQPPAGMNISPHNRPS